MSAPESRPEPTPERRAWERERFLARIRGLSRAEVVALGEAVDVLVAEGGDPKKLARGFALAWVAGPRISREETVSLDRLFVDVVVAMAIAVSGVDPQVVAGTSDRSRVAGVAFLEALFPRRQASSLTEISVRLIGNSLAPVDPQHAVVAAWNAGCAIALRGTLPSEVDTVLTAAWLRALGELPV